MLQHSSHTFFIQAWSWSNFIKGLGTTWWDSEDGEQGVAMPKVGSCMGGVLLIVGPGTEWETASGMPTQHGGHCTYFKAETREKTSTSTPSAHWSRSKPIPWTIRKRDWDLELTKEKGWGTPSGLWKIERLCQDCLVTLLLNSHQKWRPWVPFIHPYPFYLTPTT